MWVEVNVPVGGKSWPTNWRDINESWLSQRRHLHLTVTRFSAKTVLEDMQSDIVQLQTYETRLNQKVLM